VPASCMNEFPHSTGFRRLKGYRQMPTFVAVPARHVDAVPPACDAARVA